MVPSSMPADPSVSGPSVRRLPWRSAPIVVVLGAQFSTFVTGSVAWPFLAYCMYGHTRSDIPQTTHSELWATLADGRDVELNFKRLGYGYWVLWDNDIPAIRERRDPAALDRLLAAVERAHGSPPASLRIEKLKVRIIDRQFEKTPSTEPLWPLPPEPEPAPGAGAQAGEGGAP